MSMLIKQETVCRALLPQSKTCFDFGYSYFDDGKRIPWMKESIFKTPAVQVGDAALVNGQWKQ